MEVDMSSHEGYLLSRRYQKFQNKFPLRIEHSYARKDWNCNDSVLPTIYLFMSEKIRHYAEDSFDDVEVVQCIEYDELKAKNLMEECGRFAILAKCNGNINNGMDNLNPKIILCKNQQKLYKRILKILKSDLLARLAYKQVPNETILRRIALNKSSARMKRIFSSINWNPTVTSKLHVTCISSLSSQLLPIYLDVLQTLKADEPKLVKQMLRAQTLQLNPSANEVIELLVGVAWCPVTNHINKQPLSLNPSCPRPTFIFIRDEPVSMETKEWKQRWKFISRQLKSIGQVTKVLDLEKIHGSDELVDVCLRRIVREIVQVKNSDREKPIILIGRSSSSMLACEASNMEKIDGVVCLGFPMSYQQTSIANFNVPILFFIGEEDTSCSVGRLEEFRLSVKARTGLVVVGGADDQLRVSQSRQLVEEVLQPMADRCMMEKLTEFLNNILS